MLYTWLLTVTAVLDQVWNVLWLSYPIFYAPLLSGNVNLLSPAGAHHLVCCLSCSVWLWSMLFKQWSKCSAVLFLILFITWWTLTFVGIDMLIAIHSFQLLFLNVSFLWMFFICLAVFIVFGVYFYVFFIFFIKMLKVRTYLVPFFYFFIFYTFLVQTLTGLKTYPIYFQLYLCYILIYVCIIFFKKKSFVGSRFSCFLFYSWYLCVHSCLVHENTL